MNLDNSQKNMLDQELREVIEKRRQGCSAEAIEKCLAALKVNSNYIPILMQLAAIYEKNQEYDKAIIEYNKIINLRPNDSITSAKIAKLMIRIKQYDKAIIYLEKAVEMTAKLPSWVYHELGDALKESGQLDESVIAYRKALMNKPVNPALIYKKIGNILCTQKKEEEAILIYQKALESEQNNIEVCLALAKLLVKHGKTDEAISLYKDIIKDHGNSAKLYHALGQAYISKGDWDNALTYLLSAQQAQLPGSQQVYYDIGYILEKLGRQKEAKKCYQIKYEIPTDIIFKYSKLPLDWEVVDRHKVVNGVIYKQIHSQSKAILSPPKNPEKNHENFFGFKFITEPSTQIIPETYVSFIANGRVWNNHHTTAIMTLEKQLLSDISFGSATTVISAESKLQEPYKIEGTAAFLAPSIWGNGNYCRWMLNNLPRVNLLSECGVEVNSIDKFIFYDLDLSFHKETLENLRIPFDKIIKTCDHTYIEVDNLIVPSTLSHPAHKGSDWVFEFLKRLFLQESREVKTKSRRLYIHRKKGRRGIVNEEELLSFLSKYDFQVVNPGTMSVQDQAILFSTAEIVIAPHGAGLTNLAFCRAKTKIIEIFSPLYGTPAYWILASKANLDYYYLIGKDYDKSLELNTSKKGMWTHQMKDIYVDLENLLSLIQYIGL